MAWSGRDPHRQAALSYVHAWYRYQFPAWQLTIAELPGGRPWCKAEAVNPAIERSTADVIVVADADCWTEGLDAAVQQVEQGAASWAVPHLQVCRLDQATSLLVCKGEDVDPSWTFGAGLAENPYAGMIGGGVLVGRRDVLLDCPLDHRFVGWGGEDLAWGWALASLWPDWWRGESPLWHLWHPSQPRANRRYGSLESDALRRRYQKARRRPGTMRAIVEEAKLQGAML